VNFGGLTLKVFSKPPNIFQSLYPMVSNIGLAISIFFNYDMFYIQIVIAQGTICEIHLRNKMLGSSNINVTLKKLKNWK